MSNKKSSRRIKQTEFKRLKGELFNRLTIVDFTHIISLFTRSNDATLSKCREVQKKKLYKLGFFEKEKDKNDPDQVIQNFSSYTLSDDEKSLLAKGLNFPILIKKLNFADHATPFEMLYKDIKNCDTSMYKLNF